MGEFIQVDPDGRNVRAYYAEAKDGKGPGILLCHAWWGLNETFTELADRLSAEGFTVLAPDAFNGRVASTIEDAEKLIQSAESDEVIGIDQAGLDYLLNSQGVGGKRIGGIGFSFGAAYITWLAALRPELAAVVTFYGASDWNADYHKNASAPLMSHWASDDEFESTEAVSAFEAQMKEAGHTPAFYTYPDTKHWFFESNRPEYTPEAAKLAWERTVAFLKAELG